MQTEALCEIFSSPCPAWSRGFDNGGDDDNVQVDNGDDHLVLLDLVDHRDVVLSTLHFPAAEMIDNWWTRTS